ncbi:MAG: BglII/BstYI family type II restriction endonuclease [Parvibaculum sp.]
MSEEEQEAFTYSARNADSYSSYENVLPKRLLEKFEIYSYRNAASILSGSFPEQLHDIIRALEAFSITTGMIRQPGGSKGPIAKYVDTLFQSDWRETRITADLYVKLLDAKKKNEVLSEYIRKGHLDGHRIDFLKGRVALDLEWNSKDQTYDRDLSACAAFYEAGAIDVGIVLTRGNSLDTPFFKSLGNVLKKDGTEGDEAVFKKFGASTTWMGKLLYRLDAGRNGGCPILAIGITQKCIQDVGV